MMTVNEISAHCPKIFTWAFHFGARHDLNIIFLLEVMLNWEQRSMAVRNFGVSHKRGDTRIDFL